MGATWRTGLNDPCSAVMRTVAIITVLVLFHSLHVLVLLYEIFTCIIR